MDEYITRIIDGDNIETTCGGPTTLYNRFIDVEVFPIVERLAEYEKLDKKQLAKIPISLGRL